MSNATAPWVRPLVAAVSLVALRWAFRRPDEGRRSGAGSSGHAEEGGEAHQTVPSLGALSVVFITAVLFVAGAVLTTLLGVNGFIIDLDRRIPEVAQQWPIHGDPDEGRAAILAYECRACHSVPGMPDLARHGVGPPLHGVGERTYIGGVLPNSPDNLVAWLQDPPRYAPGTAMPDMGIDEATARDIAAYLLR